MDAAASILQWARKVQAIAQNGLEFSRDPFDRDRFEQLQQLVTTMLTSELEVTPGRLQGLWIGDEGYATPKVDAFCQRHRLFLPEFLFELYRQPVVIVACCVLQPPAARRAGLDGVDAAFDSTGRQVARQGRAVLHRLDRRRDRAAV